MKILYQRTSSRFLLWIVSFISLFGSLSLSAQCPTTPAFTYTINCTVVTFTNTSIPPEGTVIDNFYWDFGDGITSTEENPVHDFADPLPSQIYSVKLKITDNTGCVDSITQQITIYQTPIAGFTSSFTSCRVVSFNNTTQNNTNYTYSWDFGDPSAPSSATNPTHTYSTVSSDTNYTVILTVTDPNGCSSTSSSIISIFPSIVADFTFSPDGGCSPAVVSFDASGSTAAQTYQWTFGDGGITGDLSYATISHTYTAATNVSCLPGETFNANLVVTNNNACITNHSEVVEVAPRPLPIISDQDIYTPFSNCDQSPSPSNPNFTLTVNNNTPSTVCVDHFDISWGDGNSTLGLTSSSFPASYTYTTLGVFTLTVTATGNNGCTNNASYQVINESNPSISFGNPGSSQGCAPFTINFLVADMADNSPGTTYEFTWADGTTDYMDQTWADTATTMPHTYAQSSCPTPSYTAQVIATNQCSSTTNTTSSIIIYKAAQPNINLADTQICIDEQICPTNGTILGYGPNCVQGATYLWNFGNGFTTTSFETCNSYDAPGSYNLALSSTDYCGTLTESLTLIVIGTHAEFTADTACFNSPTHFTDLSYSYSDTTYTPDTSFPIDTWLWDFGDGGTSTVQNPSHTYSTSGYFQVILTASNGQNCDSTTTAMVYVDDLQIDSVVVTNITCNNAHDGIIQVYSSLGVGNHTYTLYPGGVSNTNGLFTGLTNGNYSIQVVDEHGCMVSVSASVINPDAIGIGSVNHTDITCHNENDGTITITGTGGTGDYTFTINPGGGSNSDGIFQFLSANTYTITIEDINGCSIVSSQIIINNPDIITITSESYTDITCHNYNNGSVLVEAIGGTGTLTYTLYKDGISDQINVGNGSFTGLSAGTYYVSVTDQFDCPAAESIYFVITNPDGISIDSYSQTDITCYNGNDGTITVIASGGTLPLIYTLTPGNIVNYDGLFTGLSSGTYTISVTDDNSCPAATIINTDLKVNLWRSVQFINLAS